MATPAQMQPRRVCAEPADELLPRTLGRTSATISALRRACFRGLRVPGLVVGGRGDRAEKHSGPDHDVNRAAVAPGASTLSRQITSLRLEPFGEEYRAVAGDENSQLLWPGPSVRDSAVMIRFDKPWLTSSTLATAGLGRRQCQSTLSGADRLGACHGYGATTTFTLGFQVLMPFILECAHQRMPDAELVP